MGAEATGLCRDKLEVILRGDVFIIRSACRDVLVLPSYRRSLCGLVGVEVVVGVLAGDETCGW